MDRLWDIARDRQLEDHGLWLAVLFAWDYQRTRTCYRITYEPQRAWRYRRRPGSRTEANKYVAD